MKLNDLKIAVNKAEKINQSRKKESSEQNNEDKKEESKTEGDES